MQDKEFPTLNRKRSNHSSFVIRDFLFIVFGTLDDIEYLDLKDPNALFKRIPLTNHKPF